DTWLLATCGHDRTGAPVRSGQRRRLHFLRFRSRPSAAATRTRNGAEEAVVGPLARHPQPPESPGPAPEPPPPSSKLVPPELVPPELVPPEPIPPPVPGATQVCVVASHVVPPLQSAVVRHWTQTCPEPVARQ